MKNLFCLLVFGVVTQWSVFSIAGAHIDGEIYGEPMLPRLTLEEFEREARSQKEPLTDELGDLQKGQLISLISAKGEGYVAIVHELSTTFTGFFDNTVRKLHASGEFAPFLQWSTGQSPWEFGSLIREVDGISGGKEVTGIDGNQVLFNGTVRHVFSNRTALVEHRSHGKPSWFHVWPTKMLGKPKPGNTQAYGPGWEKIKTFDDFIARNSGPARPVTSFDSWPVSGQLVLLGDPSSQKWIVGLYQRDESSNFRVRVLNSNGRFKQVRAFGKKTPLAVMKSTKGGCHFENDMVLVDRRQQGHGFTVSPRSKVGSN